MALDFRQRICGPAPHVTELRAVAFDENKGRAAAGLTLLICAHRACELRKEA